jgi:hypothetical protein
MENVAATGLPASWPARQPQRQLPEGRTPVLTNQSARAPNATLLKFAGSVIDAELRVDIPDPPEPDCGTRPLHTICLLEHGQKLASQCQGSSTNR